MIYGRSPHFRPNLFGRDAEANKRYSNPDHDPRGPWKPVPFLNQVAPDKRPNLCYEIINPNTGQRTLPTKKAWRLERAAFDRLQSDNRLWWGKDGRSPVPDIKRFLSEVRQGMTPINFWDHEFAGHTDDANSEIKSLFGDKVFDTPKPSKLIRRMLELATAPDSDDVILDFFAGSSTTAQAALDLNRADGGSRRFIMVQLPEPTGNPQYPTIAEIGKERIRRVLGKLKSQDEGTLSLSTRETPEDLGFRVFKLAPSHLRQWRGLPATDGQTYIQELGLFANPLEAGTQTISAIWEVALREGYGLTARIEREPTVTAQTVYRVSDPDKGQSFAICLDDRLRLDALRPLRLTKDDLFVCRDSALDDSAAANLALQCRLKTI